MKPTPLALLLLIAPLAGCADDAPTTLVDPDGGAPKAPAIAEVTGSLGAIDGNIVDLSIFPIAGANVTLEDSGTEPQVLSFVVTGEDGHFAFSLLEPATYRVRATVEGYTPKSLLVQVVPEEIAKIQLVVDQLPSTDPYVLTFEKKGIFPCAYSYAVFADSCSALGEQRNMFDYNISAGFKWIIVETTWKDSTVTMDYDIFFRKMSEPPRGTLAGGGWSPSPLRVDYWPEKKWNSTLTRIQPGTFPDGKEDFVFRTETWYDGRYQTELNRDASTVCASNPLLGYCTGVGVALDMTFVNYVTVFINDVPPGIESYSAIPDQ